MEFRMWKELPDFEGMFNINSNSYIVIRSSGIDASNQSYGIDPMSYDKAVAYALKQLKVHEKNLPTHDLKLVVIVFTHPIHTWAGSNILVGMSL